MKRIIVIALAALMSSAAMADTIGLEVGGGYWRPSFDGDVISGVDIDNELDIEDTGSLYIYAHLEHPIPFVPNLRLARTNIDEQSRVALTSNFSFEGANFTAGQVVNSDIDLSHTDFTVYYELFDVGADFDVGLTVRWIEGEIALNAVSETADAFLPMLYVRAKVDLPFTGIYLGGHVNAASYSGDSVSDAEVKVGWQKENFILPEFGVELGYRQFDMDLDDAVEVDVELSGAFLNFTGHF